MASLGEETVEEAYAEYWGDVIREKEYKNGLKEVKRFYKEVKYGKNQ